MRLSKAAREFNVGVNTLTEFLKKKGFDENFTPNSKLKPEMVALLAGEYQPDQKIKEKANEKVFTTDRTPISIAKEEEIAEEKENPEKELIIHNTGFVAEEAKAPKETLEVEKEVKAETETSVVEKPVEKVVAPNPIVPEEPKIIPAPSISDAKIQEIKKGIITTNNTNYTLPSGYVMNEASFAPEKTETTNQYN